MIRVYLFFFNDTATTEIYTLSLHDALPISDDGEVEDAFERDTRSIGEGVVSERSEEHTSELQSQSNLVCRLLLEKKSEMQAVERADRLLQRIPVHERERADGQRAGHAGR